MKRRDKLETYRAFADGYAAGKESDNRDKYYQSFPNDGEEYEKEEIDCF